MVKLERQLNLYSGDTVRQPPGRPMIMPEGESGNYIVYMLHFDRVLNGRIHYIGSTKFERRFVRWHEHALGNGSAYVRRFIRAGIGFSVARLWSCRTRQHEQVLKHTGDFKTLCPLCTPALPQFAPLHFAANGWKPAMNTHWNNRKGDAR